MSGWAFVRRCLFVLSLSVCLSFSLLFFSLFFLFSDLNSFHVDNAKAIIPCVSANWGVLPPGDLHSSHRLLAQASWRLPLLRDYWNDLPGGIRRQGYGALVLAWRGTRRSEKRYLHHWSFRSEKNQRTEDKLITLMKKVCTFFRTRKNGETRTRTSFVSKTKIKSRHGKRKNEDSPWKTKSKILPNFRAEMQKHKFQADSDRRSIQELNGIIESQRREIDHTLACDEQLRRDQLLLHEQLSEQNQDLREAEKKSRFEMEELKRVQELRIDESSRRRLIENQTLSMNTRQEFKNYVMKSIVWMTREISRLLNQFQSTSVISTFSWSWVIAEPLQWAARDLGHAGFCGKRFANPPASSSSPYPGGFNPWFFYRNRRHIIACYEWTSDSRHNLESQISVRTVSQKFIRPKWGKIFTGLWSRPTTTADFGSSFLTNSPTQQHCLLEDKIQDWGMCFFTVSNGSYAVDSRSGVGWISGWSHIFAFCQRNSWAKLWVARREKCFSTEQNHPEYPIQKKGQSGGTKKPRKRTVSFVWDRSLTWSIEYFRVTGANDSVENYADLFTVALRNDDICIPKVVRMKTGEVKYEKVYVSPRPPPKISLKHD